MEVLDLKPVYFQKNEFCVRGFLRTQRGLFVSPFCRDYVIAITAKEDTTYVNSELGRTLGYADYFFGEFDVFELPDEHIFMVSNAVQFFGTIAAMVKEDWNGTKFNLINDGNTNVFVAWINNRFLCIEIEWSSSLSEWQVSLRETGSLRLDERHCRIISPQNYRSHSGSWMEQAA